MRKKEDLLNSKEKLKKWIQQDRLSCGYSAVPSFKEKITRFFAPNYILLFEHLLREVEYLTNCKSTVWGG